MHIIEREFGKTSHALHSWIARPTEILLACDGEQIERYLLPCVTGEKRELFFSYIHSTARGDLNDFNNYLGSFPTPIVRPNQYANLPGDLPNRFLAWGAIWVMAARHPPYRTWLPHLEGWRPRLGRSGFAG